MNGKTLLSKPSTWGRRWWLRSDLMAKWWEVVMNTLGLSSVRPPKPVNGQTPHDTEQGRINRIADQEAREDARKRVAALDLRVDVLTRRMAQHERKKSH